MASPEADAWFIAAPASQQATLTALRRLVISLESGIAEEIKWGRPCYSTNRGLFCYMQSTKNHAALGFQQGASLNDPEGILEGTGKDMRHVKFKDGAKFNEAVVAALLEQAIE